MRLAKLAKRSSLLLALCGILVTAACGGGDDDDDNNDDGNGDDAGNDDGGNDDTPTDDDGGEDDGGVNPGGEDNTYVVDRVLVPTSMEEVTTYGLDLDGDDVVDNALGSRLLSLSSLAEIDVAGAVNAQVDQGGIILLANLKATALTDATGVGFSVYLGAEPNPAACESEADTECRKHLQGGASFAIAADSPTGALVVGEIADSHFTGGPGEVTIELALGDGEPLQIDLIGARIEVDVNADGLAEGRLAGAITAEEADTEIVPQIVTLIANVIDENCSGAGTEPAPCGCSGATEIVRNLFDTNPADDCVVSADEVRNNGLTQTLLAPDVDLLPAVEGDDSISLGVGFSAVTGTFTPPAAP